MPDWRPHFSDVDRQLPIFPMRLIQSMIKSCRDDGKQVHPQTIRMYERLGLIKPNKEKRVRYYSRGDLERIEVIQSMIWELGISMPGMIYIFAMLDYMQERGATGPEIQRAMNAGESATKRMKGRSHAWKEINDNLRNSKAGKEKSGGADSTATEREL